MPGGGRIAAPGNRHGNTERQKAEKRVTNIFCSGKRDGGGMTAGKPFAYAVGKPVRQQRDDRQPSIRVSLRQGMIQKGSLRKRRTPVARMREGYARPRSDRTMAYRCTEGAEAGKKEKSCQETTIYVVWGIWKEG